MSYYIEQMRDQSAGVRGWHEGFEFANGARIQIVNKNLPNWRGDFMGCPVATVGEGTTVAWPSIKPFATFLRNEPKHKKPIRDMEYVGNPDGDYAIAFKWLMGELTQEQMQEYEHLQKKYDLFIFKPSKQ